MSAQEYSRQYLVARTQLNILLNYRKRVQVDTSTLASIYQRHNTAARELIRTFINSGGAVYYSNQVNNEFLGSRRDFTSAPEYANRSRFFQELNLQVLPGQNDGTFKMIFGIGVSLLGKRHGEEGGLDIDGDVLVGAAAYAAGDHLITSDRHYLHATVTQYIEVIYAPEPNIMRSVFS